MRSFVKCFIVFLIAIVFIKVDFVFATEINIEKLQMHPVKLFDVPKPDGYDGLQGMIITDQYIVVAAVKNDDSSTALIAYDKDTHELVTEEPVVSSEYGHANDMAYIPESNTIVIADKNHLYLLNGDTLEKINTIELTSNAMGVAYINNSQYLLRDNTSLYYFDGSEMTNLEVDISNTYSQQGISVLDDDIFYSTYVASADENFEAETSVIFDYTVNGLQRVYYIEPGLGELQAYEFDEYEPYFLFQTSDGNGAIYILEYEQLTTSFDVAVTSTSLDISSMDFKAQLKSYDGSLHNSVYNDGKFTFDNISFASPGNYNFTVSQFVDEENISVLYDKKNINFEAQVRYDAASQGLLVSDVVYENENTFNNEINRDAVACEVFDGIYYDDMGNEVTEEEFMDICKVVENPQTGSFVPITFLSILGLLAIGIIFYRKKIFYRI